MRVAHCILSLAAAAGAAAQIVLPWTTDSSDSANDAQIGLDGPWQAPTVQINGKTTPLWPGGSSVTDLLTKSLGGSYEPSSSAVKTRSSMANSDSWFSSLFLGGGPSGFAYYEAMRIDAKAPASKEVTVNATVVSAEEWLADNSASTAADAAIGLLGLATNPKRSISGPGVGILDQLKSAGEIERRAFSVHMGSAALAIPGSAVLGGYEKNRALGPVSAFAMQEQMPLVVLSDVVMGVETGDPSPFPASSSGSFWVAPNELGRNLSKVAGGDDSSIVAIPNPASPYIYLQPGVCEKLAENLGLKLHDKTGLYLWESSRPGSVEDFLKSPSYLGFVFSDRTSKNLTIKVPFQLLNLTLKPPLVEKEAAYFPCKSIDSSYGFWQLGRAFLQAAFFAVDYEESAFYLAQGPGPGLEQSDVQKLQTTGPESNPIESFQSSWSKSWTVTGSGAAKNDTKDGSSGAVTAGVSIAAVVGAAILGL
ncbi:hypothetical protein CPLU01_03732 [Colletotrichum plurivorum]|uniref:Peptidase A1 domain-containing protein n=1 Tax=Colletotrichum plurivorum TaxID=2175906 RepID=A0A8H6NKS8_9PEZI|nr:hypothetical protein CPLU01_03732 [Colletotrichum plurivorum]